MPPATRLLRGAGGVLLDEAGREVAYGVDGVSNVQYCFGGMAATARDLAGRNWDEAGTARIADATPAALAVNLKWPRRMADGALDRASGCLLGQVIGDSLGSLVEFQGPGRIAQDYPAGVRDLADGGTWNTIAGQPTDDSELALDLARTLAGLPAFSAEAVTDAYAAWFASMPFDIGTTTNQALAAADSVAVGQGGRGAGGRQCAEPGERRADALRTDRASGPAMPHRRQRRRARMPR